MSFFSNSLTHLPDGVKPRMPHPSQPKRTTLCPIPALYPVLDAGFLASVPDREVFLRRLMRDLAEAGVGILQYRNKSGDRAEILADGRVIRDAVAGLRMLLILNDWPELAIAVGFDGVHVGQTDVSAAEARGVVGPGKIVGVSTHNEAQLRAADLQPLDYIAIGPVFATATKENPDPVVGLEGVRLARSITRKPVVAIGGITLENAAQVREAGADSVAVITAVFAPGRDPEKACRDLMALF
ncbi:MAG TPA: thiamine phosphate synthase [Silvibacterium sp.]|nr:thiamine phosphate synthase [Silvibacterium sp.]